MAIGARFKMLPVDDLLAGERGDLGERDFCGDSGGVDENMVWAVDGDKGLFKTKGEVGYVTGHLTGRPA